MKNAVIASEDRRFYNHWGIDSRSIVRAVVINIISLGYVQGFSSLTQQVARTLYDTIGFKKTITRKIKEIITAIQIDASYTHLRAHETKANIVCRLLLEKKKSKKVTTLYQQSHNSYHNINTNYTSQLTTSTINTKAHRYKI